MKLFDIFKRDTRTEKQKVGDLGEKLAVRYLRKHFYVILERNWRCGKNEIDIIATKKGELIFIEVKTTASDSSESFAPPSKAVTLDKQRHLIEAARDYLYWRWEINKNKIKALQSITVPDKPTGRFDVIEVYLNREKPEINHIINAFYVEKGNKRKWKT